ncbi:sigma factor-like helix-turn-helix DNA-binding protein, partial [Clostridioides difficile]|uniref:sigma factor-like helix-turn-helix DNA-binding protein n=1 Tax=Clostridioides difficile TaxID=1496 RepID=UPI00234ED3CF
MYEYILNKIVDVYIRYDKLNFDVVDFDEHVLNMKNNYQSKSVFEEDICFFEYILKELSGIQRKVIFYKYLKGYSDREISVKLKISRQAVNKACLIYTSPSQRD